MTALTAPPLLARRSKSLDHPAPAQEDALRGGSSDSEVEGGSWSDSPFSGTWGPRSAPLAIPRPASLDDHIEAFHRLPSLRDWAGSGGSNSRFVMRQPSLNDWMSGSSPAFLSRGSSGRPPLRPIPDLPDESAGPDPPGGTMRQPPQPMLSSPGPPRSPKRSRSPARMGSQALSEASSSSLSEMQLQHQDKAPRLAAVAAVAEAGLAQQLSPGSPDELAAGFREFKEVMDTMYSGPQLAQQV